MRVSFGIFPRTGVSINAKFALPMDNFGFFFLKVTFLVVSTPFFIKFSHNNQIHQIKLKQTRL